MWTWLLTALADPCPTTAAVLPPSALYDAADPRLQGDALIVVLKEARLLALYTHGDLAKTPAGEPACWPVALAAGYVEGHKQRRGDLRTPEGWQRTSDRPWSSFYAAISVHYPAPHDAARGHEAGWIDQETYDAILEADRTRTLPPMDTKLGGRIVIHGGGGLQDWTLGCVGLEDTHIDLLRGLLPSGMRTDLLVLP